MDQLADGAIDESVTLISEVFRELKSRQAIWDELFSASGCRHYWRPAGPRRNPRLVNMSPFSFPFLFLHGMEWVQTHHMRPSRGFPALHHLLSGLCFFQLRLFGPEFGGAIRVYCVQYIENCSVLSHIRIPHRATGHRPPECILHPVPGRPFKGRRLQRGKMQISSLVH